jgi:hypothetical protein
MMSQRSRDVTQRTEQRVLCSVRERLEGRGKGVALSSTELVNVSTCLQFIEIGID